MLHSYLGRSGASYQIAEISGLVIIANDQATLKLASNVGDRVRRLKEAISFLTSPVPQPDRRPARGRGGQRRRLTARDIERLSDSILGLLRKSPPRNRFGDYEVIEQLRRTETSVDFLGRHLRLKKRGLVRLRVYEFDRYMETPQHDAQQRLIMREMEALTTLQDHPNIIRAYDPFEWDGNKICAPTEWISNGFTLRDQLDESGPLKLDDLKSLVSQACAGLAFAHANGVVHRGLSPDSILLSPTGLVKLIDFDYARVPELATLSGMEISLGDTPYAAPEQVADSLHANHQADIYGLGVTLYEALTGQLPNIPDPTAPSSLNVNVPTALDTVVLMMMAQDPTVRYQSAEEVGEALAGVMIRNSP